MGAFTKLQLLFLYSPHHLQNINFNELFKIQLVLKANLKKEKFKFENIIIIVHLAEISKV